jgi:hypothetical protein
LLSEGEQPDPPPVERPSHTQANLTQGEHQQPLLIALSPCTASPPTGCMYRPFSSLHLNKVHNKPQPQRAGRGGRLLVLGRGKASKVVAPKLVNLPSAKKGNHGLDPTVQLVPTGARGWAAPNTTRGTRGSQTREGRIRGMGPHKAHHQFNAGPPVAPSQYFTCRMFPIHCCMHAIELYSISQEMLCDEQFFVCQ